MFKKLFGKLRGASRGKKSTPDDSRADHEEAVSEDDQSRENEVIPPEKEPELSSGLSREPETGSSPGESAAAGVSDEDAPPPETSPESSQKTLPPPLQGVRILDLTRLYPGPLATMMLAEMGAEVIKLEDSNQPDYMRTFPPFVNNQSAGFLAVNRSKRSIALNLPDARGREIFFRLVKQADVVVEQYRPGKLTQLGIDYPAACQHNPAIIYVSLTGYGQTGPYAGRPGHDINYIGYSGLLGLTAGAETGPVIPGVQIADIAGGAYMTVIAVLSALWARERNGEGQQVDVSMLDGVLPLTSLQLAHHWALGQALPPWQQPLSGGLACYGVYECADGKYVALGALEPKFWQRFCEIIEKPEWNDKGMEMGETAEQIKAELTRIFKSRSRDEWLQLQGDRDACLSPVLALPEIEQDPHIKARGMIVTQEHPTAGKVKGIGLPIRFSASPLAHPSHAPLTGEHSIEILQEAGYPDDEIKELIRRGVVMIVEE